MNYCKNCSELLEKNYCSNCGQTALVKRISINQLIKDIPHAIFHLDGGFFYNARELFVRPGFAIKEYLAGKRKPFFHPVTYLAILLVLNYLAVKVTDLHYYDEAELASMSASQAAFIIKYDETQWWFLEQTYLYMLIAIPACSVFYYFFFRLFKYRFNLAENAVILMFIIAQGVMLQSIIYFLTGWVRNGIFIRTVEIVNGVILLLYAAYAMYNFIHPQKNKFWVGLLCVLGGSIVLSLMIASAFWLLELSHL
jgi:hypothetical protein